MSGELLSGTVALVTGASSGIGEATAYALARAGAAVALVARREDRLDRISAEIKAEGGQAVSIAADLTVSGSAIEVVDRCRSEFGRIDVVVNNAGLMLLGPVLDAPWAEWDRMVRLNVEAALAVAHATLPSLIEAAGSGPRQVADLVNISSAAGRFARAGSAVYNLTKFGLGGFSEALRQEMAPHHVRVSVLEPGAVATELRDHIRDDLRPAALARMAEMEPMESEDLAELIVYVVTRPRRMALNEIVLRPTVQAN